MSNTSRIYDMDGLGNWMESDYVPVGGTQNTDVRQHNKLNEMLNRQIDDDAKVLYEYDKNGNLINDGTLSYYYDALNRLIQVNRIYDGQQMETYGYDALNRRISKTVSNGGLSGDIPNGTTDFLYLEWQVVEERNSSTTTKQYVWGQYIDECIQLKTLATTGQQSLPTGDYYPLQDLLYRTKALTDSSGNIVEAYDYDAYGNTLIFSATGTGSNWWADDATQANYAACEVLYDGYRYDTESKLYQVRNREYNPVLGRWLQRDPIGFDGGDWNLYGYVKDNPMNGQDAYGFGLAVTAGIGAAVIAGAVIYRASDFNSVNFSQSQQKQIDHELNMLRNAASHVHDKTLLNYINQMHVVGIYKSTGNPERDSECDTMPRFSRGFGHTRTNLANQFFKQPLWFQLRSLIHESYHAGSRRLKEADDDNSAYEWADKKLTEIAPYLNKHFGVVFPTFGGHYIF